MTNTSEPIGQRFSQIYLIEPELLQDSVRMRRRLGLLFFEVVGSSLRYKMNHELGTSLGNGGSGIESYWPLAFTNIALRDVLDTVTLVVRDSDGGRKNRLLSEIRRIFREEQVRYRVDDQGGVHFAVDAQFESSRIAVIAKLGKQRYAGVRTAFEGAFAALDQTPPDGKASIRYAFFAVEGLFRLIFAGAHQLSGAEVQKHLKPLVDKTFDGQKPAIYLAQKQVAAFSDWIDGAHFYRHEPGTEEPAQPPLSLAIYMVAQAGAHLRWLADFDKA